MGGRSSSSSSSSTKTTTNTEDNRVTVGEGGLGVGAGAEVTLTDFGVIEGAAGILEAGLDAAAKTVKTVTDSFGEVVKENNAVLREQAESDIKEVSELIIKAGVAFGIVVAIAAVIFGKKR